MSNPTIDNLFLELSQLTSAKTAKEMALESSLELAQRERDMARMARQITQDQIQSLTGILDTTRQVLARTIGERNTVRTADNLTTRQLMDAQATIARLEQRLGEAEAALKMRTTELDNTDALLRAAAMQCVGAVIPGPTLTVRCDSEHVWLRFETPDGQEASITLAAIMQRIESHSMLYKTLAAWGNAVRAKAPGAAFEEGVRDDITIKMKPAYLYPPTRTDFDAPGAPKPKLIDMAKLPAGTLVYDANKVVTGTHRIKEICNVWGVPGVVIPGRGRVPAIWLPLTRTRIAEQTEFTPWNGDLAPDMPDGLRVEARLRSGETRVFSTPKLSPCPQGPFWWHGHEQVHNPNDIMAYRVIGVADGWTDDPEKAK